MSIETYARTAVADCVSQMISRIDLALALSEQDHESEASK